jgi:hypothetical protein
MFTALNAREHHCFLLGQHLRTIEPLEETIAACIEAKLTPFAAPSST